MPGIVRNKITIKDLDECFERLLKFNCQDKIVVMFHPTTRDYKVLTVALEYDDDNTVYGDPYIKFKQYTTVTNAKVWKLETDIDIVSGY